MFQDVNAEWSVEASMSKFLLGVVVNTSQLSQAHVRRFNWQYTSIEGKAEVGNFETISRTILPLLP